MYNVIKDYSRYVFVLSIQRYVPTIYFNRLTENSAHFDLIFNYYVLFNATTSVNKFNLTKLLPFRKIKIKPVEKIYR